MMKAATGDAEAQYELGYDYESGHLIKKDVALAARWYRKAAEQGIVGAEFNLGVLYADGEGVPQDYAQAVVWYRKAAEQGDARAQNNLAGLYGLGEGVPQDSAEAYFWYDIALAGDIGDKEKREKTEKVRDMVANHLTPAKLQQVQARATKWFEEHKQVNNTQ